MIPRLEDFFNVTVEDGPPPLWPTRTHKRLACIGLVVGAITASILTVCIGATIWVEMKND
ncbi:Protein CBG25179 [Caenorhabditis briggsae]|uniref:Protein CBG25179 n=1 Tax=Caenorhabditis briggsae TaxID=6238 RepID=B6IFZ9_CAEBR|nr:Protein CBG25179 [Caenorhabditis briggsae]CAR98829.1 Protein CBG25179 [Caenorhabditis briggsae]